MTTQTNTTDIRPFDYRSVTEAVLKTVRRDRDRQIIARRFGFGMARRQTLEQIGQDFGITRERVRQIEKATMARLRAARPAELTTAGELLRTYLGAKGGIARAGELAASLDAAEQGSQAYLLFLASLAPDIEVIEEGDHLHQVVVDNRVVSARQVRAFADELVKHIAAHGKPVTLDAISGKLSQPVSRSALEAIAGASKDLACFEGKWGLSSWPSVNPKSIRDKTFLVLKKHKQPLHFSEIARHIKDSSFVRRDVTVQAVHNELIKDPRFILIGRGIYALAEWGYAPGTVADIIVDILKQESPLHKDEIVRRVLEKRQVKTTTIVLNLQEKSQFERVAKATYKLKDK